MPIYNNVTVDPAGLTCLPWDQSRGTGGILAFFAVGELTLKGNIDVSGQGFHGADPGNENYTGACANDSVSYDNLNYPASSLNRAGYKGEGIFVDDSAKLKGRGFRLSNPGGGNGKFSGGGGGSNFAGGGIGGSQVCSDGMDLAGSGGQDLSQETNSNCMYLGSGGGTGTQILPDIPASRGGNGGGIVLIVTQKINSPDGESILANGSDAETAIGGAGGGGGGGLILLDADKCTGTLNLSVKGGNGGNTESKVIGTNTIIGGVGGGGGGGFIWGRSELNCIPNDSAGFKGSNPTFGFTDAHSGIDGSVSWEDLAIQTKGFLFNYLPAVDTICKGSKPDSIIGSFPRGGDGTYDFQWLVSTDKVIWKPATSISNNSSLQNFQPPDSISVKLFDSIYYERVVYSGYFPDSAAGTYAFVDISPPYSIRLYPPIKNNVIASLDSTLCSGTIPDTMKGTLPTNGRSGQYSYYWELSSSLTDWSKADTVGTGQSYYPSQPLTAKSNDSLYYFRRAVNSGGCTDANNSIVLKILPRIKGNHIIPNQVLCQNILPLVLSSDSSLTGGDKNYRKTWEVDSIGGTWSTVDTSLNYQSPGLKVTTQIKRIVKSGPGDVCQNTSNTITLTVRPSIKNNKLISTDTTICAGFAPDRFLGYKPSGGDTTSHYYLYSWLLSTDSIHWKDIYQAHGDTTGYASGPLSLTSWFKRKVVSGIEAACKDSNNLIKVTVQPRIANNLIASLDTICKGQVPSISFTTNDSVPTGGNGIYRYLWQQSHDGLNWESITRPSNHNTLQPDSLNSDRFYRRLVLSGACFDTTQHPLLIKVLQPIGNNSDLISDTIVCKGTSAKTIHIIGNPTGGNGLYKFSWYKWKISDDTSSLSVLSGETASTLDAGLIDTTTFIRRRINSGPSCQSISKTLTIAIHQLPVAYLSGPQDSSICDNGKLMNIRVKMHDGKPPWNIYLADTFSVYNIYSSDTTVIKSFKPVSGEKQIFTFTIDSLIDANRCSAVLKSGQIVATIYSLPVSAYAPLTDTTCGNQYHSKKAGKPAYDVGTWRFDSANISVSDIHDSGAIFTDKRLSATVLLDTVNLKWNVYNWDSSCSVNLSSTILFYNNPVARILEPAVNFTGEKDTLVFNHDLCTLHADTVLYPNTGRWSYTSSGSAVQFSPENSPTTQVSPLLTNGIPGKWKVYWIVQNPGCRSAMEMSIDTAIIESMKIHPYKGFSPGYGFKNSDGKLLDEVYWIEGIEYEPDFTLTILSGWNTLVYFYHGSGDQWTGWDGKGNQFDNNGKDMPEGTYYYILEVKGQKLTGTILLRRKT